MHTIVRLSSLWALLWIVLLAAGCLKPKVTAPPAQSEPPATESRPTPRSASSLCEQQKDDIRRALTVCQEENQSRRVDNQRMRIALLEKEARNRQLEAQLSFQKQMVDETVNEVVRTKAKLRSVESKAEAASTMAETEIAIIDMKALASSGSIGSSEHLIKADTLIKKSTEEFNSENYGGALYLAEQARIQIRAIKKSIEQTKLSEKIGGEVDFIPPLELKLLKRSNLRRSPALTAEVQRVLEKGTLIIGYSHKDEWIRVNTEDGQLGWIHQTLVDAR